MTTYMPSKLFKSISNTRLKDLFGKFGIAITVDWENRKQSETNAIAEAWSAQKLEKSKDRNIALLHDLFQNIFDIGDAKVNSTRIADELARDANPSIELDKDFHSWNRFDQAAYIYLNMHDTLWRPFSDIVLAEEMSLTKKWTDYNELPCKEPDVSTEGIKHLEEVVTQYFKEEKKCEATHIEYYSRYNELYFFFATLDDSPTFIEMKSPGGKDFETVPAVMPYRIIFAYNFSEGEFSLYAPISVSEKDKLAARLIKVLVGHDGDLKRLSKPTYNISELNKRDFSFASDPTDCLSNIHVKTLTVAPPDAPSIEITFKDKSGNVYDAMDTYLDHQKLPVGNIEVQRATITMKVDNPSYPFRSLTFELSEKTCTLKSLPESKRVLGEKLLKMWGLKNA